MYCWHCKEKIELSERKVSFRGVCPKCEADLHVCKNCRFYTPGRANDCYIPGTEYVADREKANFCEEFVFSEKKPEKGDKNKETNKKTFGSLFKD